VLPEASGEGPQRNRRRTAVHPKSSYFMVRNKIKLSGEVFHTNLPYECCKVFAPLKNIIGLFPPKHYGCFSIHECSKAEFKQARKGEIACVI
jgi:hypothetical protein